MDNHISQDSTTLDARTLPGPLPGVQDVPKKATPPRRRPLARTLAIVATCLLLLALLGVLFSPDPQLVDLARASRGAMAVTVSSEGITRVKEQYDVTAPVGGRLLRVPLKAGDAVVANQTVVATIEPPPPQFNDMRAQAELEAKTKSARSALAQARADLERTRAQLEFAEADMVRNKDLAARGVTATRTLEQFTMEVQTRRAAYLIAQKAVDQKVSEVEQTTASLIGPTSPGGEAAPRPVEVRSPVDGRVLNVLRESETVVTPGQPILSVGNPGQIEVMLEMLSEDAVKVREGSAATLEGWGGPPLHMRVRRVEPFGYTKISALGIEEQRVHVLLDFTDPPETRRALGHGYRVTGKILLWDGDQVLKLPMGALFRDGARWAVYFVERGTARLRHVELGHLNDTEAEVLKGVAADDQVILHPSDRIAEGVPVRPRS